MITVNVMYPNKQGASFNFDYYLNDHLAMVQKHWGPMGLQGARVIKGLAGGEPNSDAPYLVIAQVLFNSMEEFQAAADVHGAAIFGDVPNFTDLTPEVQISEVLAEA